MRLSEPFNLGLVATAGVFSVAASVDPATQPIIHGGVSEEFVLKVLICVAAVLNGLRLLIREWRETAPKFAPPGPTPPAAPSLLLTLGLSACLALGAVGCQASPASRVAVANEGYTLALNAASAVREAGEMNDETYWRVEAARVVAAAGLDVLTRQAREGVTLDHDTIATVEAAVRRMAEALRKAHARTPETGVSARGSARGRDEPNREDQGRRPGTYGGRLGVHREETSGRGSALAVSGPEGVTMLDQRYFADNMPFTLPAGDAGVIETLWVMRAAAEHAVSTGGPTARLATRVAADSGRGEVEQARGVYRWCREHIIFKRDPHRVENVRHPDQLALEVAEYGNTAADCDDVATLAAAMMLHCGIRPALVVVSTKPSGAYHHVTPAAWLAGRLVVIDPQERMWDRLPRTATRAAALSW